jgi:hypothetical protein
MTTRLTSTPWHAYHDVSEYKLIRETKDIMNREARLTTSVSEAEPRKGPCFGLSFARELATAMNPHTTPVSAYQC